MTPCGQLLQVSTKPPAAAPPTLQVPELTSQPGMQAHEIADVPQVCVAHEEKTAPLETMTQICPGAQMLDPEQENSLHGPLLSDQRADAALPATQVATVRPAPAQSS